MVNLWRSIEEMPVLAREGAVIPLKDMEIFDNSTDNPENMEVRIFPGKEGSFTLWEDEGDTAEDLDENWVSTVMKKGRCTIWIDLLGKVQEEICPYFRRNVPGNSVSST